MPTPESTCWTVIRAAAAGSPTDREQLARRYVNVVRAYLAARWRGSPLLAECDDGGQEGGRGPEAVGGVELLQLRFAETLPIRTIAARWGVDPARLHHDYAIARQEFRAALLEVVAFHQPGSPVELEQEAASLLKAL